MIKRLFPILGLFLVVATVTNASAQAGDLDVLTGQELANARTMIQEGREAIIREDLHLNIEEEAAFWPLYAEYRADLMPIQDRSVVLTANYMRQYESGMLTDEYAEEMLEGYFSIKIDLLKAREKYIRRFKKILPMLKVARFYQLENKMNADIDAELAFLVPLIESN